MDEELNLEIIESIEAIANRIFYLQPLLAIIGILIIIPHLIITTQKSMRTSSTNSLIIGIALCDLIVLSEIFHYRIFATDYTDPCHNPDTYTSQVSFIFSYFCPETFTRSAFWAGLSLALIRFLVIKYPMNTRISELARPSIGYQALLFVFLLNFLPSANYYFRFEIIKLNDWIPAKKCRGYPVNYSENAYLADMESDSQVHLYQVISSTLQLTVTFTHPILAILLFFEIRKVAKKAANISRNSSTDKGRTSQMILLMTISFVISSLPVGLEIVLRGSFEYHSIMDTLLGYSTFFDTMLFAINGSVHCIICFTMSSEYRKTVKNMLRIKEKEKIVIVNSMPPKNSVT